VGECSIGAVKRRLALIVGGGAAAGAAAYRVLQARRRAPEPDPAAELRSKLDESRTMVGERDEFEAAETPVDRAEPGVEERRRSVHEQGRAAIDAMKKPDDA
jgi:hypothetical protein